MPFQKRKNLLHLFLYHILVYILSLYRSFNSPTYTYLHILVIIINSVSYTKICLSDPGYICKKYRNRNVEEISIFDGLSVVTKFVDFKWVRVYLFDKDGGYYESDGDEKKVDRDEKKVDRDEKKVERDEKKVERVENLVYKCNNYLFDKNENIEDKCKNSPIDKCNNYIFDIDKLNLEEFKNNLNENSINFYKNNLNETKNLNSCIIENKNINSNKNENENLNVNENINSTTDTNINSTTDTIFTKNTNSITAKNTNYITKLNYIQNSTPNKNKIILKYCEECNIFKPQSINHCRECNNCVLEMDHHCYWFDTCVGRNNLSYFYIYIYSGIIVLNSAICGWNKIVNLYNIASSMLYTCFYYILFGGYFVLYPFYYLLCLFSIYYLYLGVTDIRSREFIKGQVRFKRPRIFKIFERIFIEKKDVLFNAM